MYNKSILSGYHAYIAQLNCQYRSLSGDPQAVIQKLSQNSDSTEYGGCHSLSSRLQKLHISSSSSQEGKVSRNHASIMFSDQGTDHTLIIDEPQMHLLFSTKASKIGHSISLNLIRQIKLWGPIYRQFLHFYLDD